MSVNLMSAIFEAEFFDLTDDNGNTTKASTAKLVLLAMADHANDEGEGAYPSIEKLCKKTALSEQTIRNTFDALRYNGIISLVGKSKWGTNNHTINTKSFPRAIGKEVTYLTLYPLDPQMSTEKGSNEYKSSTYPLDPNHLTIQEPSLHTDEMQGEYKTKQDKDLIDHLLDMANFPGAKAEARRASIQSYLAERLHVNTETKAWREFAKYADGQQQKGESVEVFVAWLLGQDKFQIQYWPPRRMMEMWPQAFIKNDTQERTTSTGYFA